MRSVTVTILFAFAMPGLGEVAKQQMVSDAKDKLADMMIDRLLGASLQGENLDESTLAKTGAAVQSVGRSALAPLTRPLPPAIASLPGPTALKTLAISAMEASNRRSCFALNVVPREVWGGVSPGDIHPQTEWRGKGYSLSGEGQPLTVDQVKKLPGISAPYDQIFDPLGIATKVPEGNLLWFRNAEIKHGRVCMLASLGMIVSEKFHPLFGGDIDVPSALLGGPAVEQTGFSKFWLAILIHVGVFDVLSEQYRATNELPPGDYTFDPFKFTPKDPVEFKGLQNRELNNGRLAMFATMGILGQELATGQKIF